MEALQEELKKLKEENDYLKAIQSTHIEDINSTHDKYRDMVLTLKTQKNKLSKKNTELRKKNKEHVEHFNLLLELVQTAKNEEQIEKLKELAEKRIKIS